MLMLIMVQAELNGSTEDLNTSHVNVNQKKKKKTKLRLKHLNTSHVNVNLLFKQ